MANVSLKTDFQNGDKLYDYELNNNFRAIKAALEAMNKITWQDDTTGVGVSAYKGNTEAIEARELIDGQLLYNTETGETYIDTYVDAVLSRINTGSGNVVAIQPTEPTNEAVKLWIEEDTLDTLDSEIVNEYSESTQLGYSADYVNKNIVSSGSNTNGTYIKYSDGTLICYSEIEIYSVSPNSSETETWTFPVEFYNNKYVCFSELCDGGAYWASLSTKFTNRTTTNVILEVYNTVLSGTAGDSKWYVVAIGRWK